MYYYKVIRIYVIKYNITFSSVVNTKSVWTSFKIIFKSEEKM